MYGTVTIRERGSSSSSSNLTSVSTGGGSRRSLLATRSRSRTSSSSSKKGTVLDLDGRWDNCNMFVCVSPHAPALDDDHHNFDDFPKPHLQSGLICFISPDTFPPPTLGHFLFL
jgi:hypothetical protein